MSEKIHEDCGTVLDAGGYCEKCNFCPDMQSISIRQETSLKVPSGPAGRELYLTLDNNLKLALAEAEELVARGGDQHKLYHALKNLAALVRREVGIQGRKAYLDANLAGLKNPEDVRAAILELEDKSRMSLEECTAFTLRVQNIR